jgi:hypothetical protein
MKQPCLFKGGEGGSSLIRKVLEIVSPLQQSENIFIYRVLGSRRHKTVALKTKVPTPKLLRKLLLQTSHRVLSFLALGKIN